MKKLSRKERKIQAQKRLKLIPEKNQEFKKLLDLCIKLTQPYVTMDNMFSEDKNMNTALCSLNGHFKRMMQSINVVTCKEVEMPKGPIIKESKITGSDVSLTLVGNPDKSYDGIFLGKAVTGYQIDDKNTTDKKIALRSGMFSDMPIIYVPELKKLIYGYESFWKIKQNIEDKVTKDDLNNYKDVVSSLLKEVNK